MMHIRLTFYQVLVKKDQIFRRLKQVFPSLPKRYTKGLVFVI